MRMAPPPSPASSPSSPPSPSPASPVARGREPLTGSPALDGVRRDDDRARGPVGAGGSRREPLRRAEVTPAPLAHVVQARADLLDHVVLGRSRVLDEEPTGLLAVGP